VKFSDELTKLAARAKEAEDHVASAMTKGKGALEDDVETARQSAQAHADQLKKNAETDKEILSSWWSDLSQSWNDHVATVRGHVAEKRAEHDRDAAERHASSAEEDADYAIQYAYATIEEAEAAVLEAILARKDADDLAAGVKT
jgi:hypothetical protein